MFMRSWKDCPVRVTHGRLREWVIFTRRKGDIPNKDTGEVMYHLDHYSRAILLDGVRTEPTIHTDEAEFMFVMSGRGLVRAGDVEQDVRDGASFRIPAGVEHTLTNTGTEDIELLVMRCAPHPDGRDRAFEAHNWREDRPQAEWGTPFQGHWNHIYKGPHVRIHAANLPPRTISHPHSHQPRLDELWYVAKGQGWHWMGKELQPQGPGCALWLVPEEVHSLINPSDETVEYIYCRSEQ